MGAIMAVGIAVSNSILLVSFANDYARREARTLTPLEAALEAGRTRLRPVIMTALAMIIGMVPMALGARRGGRAERAARPRRHRRPGDGHVRDAVRGAGGLRAVAQEAADAAPARGAVPAREAGPRTRWRCTRGTYERREANQVGLRRGRRRRHRRDLRRRVDRAPRARRWPSARRASATDEVAKGPRVRVARAQLSPPVRKLELQGEARPFASATVYAKVSGYLEGDARRQG